MSDRFIGLILLLICGVMWLQTYSIRTPPFAQFEQVNSAFFPRMIIGALAVCSVLMLARGSGGLSPAAGGAAVARFVRERQRILVSLAMFVGYIAALPIIGYVPTTAIYLTAMQLYLRPRSPRQTALVFVASGLVSYALAWFFVSRINVVLPAGIF